LAADGYEPLGAQTDEETRVKLRHHGPALLVLGGLGDDRRAPGLVRAIRSGARAQSAPSGPGPAAQPARVRPARPLAAEPTRVFTKCELLREVWGFKATGITR
jgi:hypothetical protein